MAQQTAVEWFYQQTVIEGKTNYSDILEQAKQMEKEQIIMSHVHNRCLNNKTYGCTTKAFEEAEQYYNETYGIK